MVGIIVHEWLEQYGGAESVLNKLADVYPDASITTLWNDVPDRFSPGRVKESWLARTPLRRHKALGIPLQLITWRHRGHSDAEWILCTSHLFGHHARYSGPARHARKFVYVYTPARYIWAPELDSRGSGLLARAAGAPLRVLDRRRAQEANSLAVVSEFVRDRVRTSWRRDAIVIHPPVDVARFTDPGLALTPSDQEILDSLPESFLLGASRLVPYKRLDLVIAAGLATDLPVVIAGDGPMRMALETQAAQHPGSVTFVRRPSHELLAAIYRRSLAFVFPAIEDFGLMPVEAMATGTPVIAASTGGAAESVVHGVTGFLVDRFDGQELRDAVAQLPTLDRKAIVRRAHDFSPSEFERHIREWVGE